MPPLPLLGRHRLSAALPKAPISTIPNLCSLLFPSRYRSSKWRRLPSNRTRVTKGRQDTARLSTDFGTPRGALDARDHIPPRGPTYPPNFLPRRSTWRQVLLTYQGSFPPTTAYEGLSFLSKDTNLVAAEDVHGNRATYHNNINLSMVLCVT